MKRFYAITMCLLTILVSCQTNQSQIVDGAKQIESRPLEWKTPLKTRIQVQDNMALLGAVAVYPVRDQEVLLQVMTGDWCFKWMNLETGEIKGLVRRGRGPGEMLDAGFAGSRVLPDGLSRIYFYSLASSELVAINLEKTLADGSASVELRQNLPGGTMYALASDSDILGYRMDSNNRVDWYSIQEKGDVSHKLFPFGDKGRVKETDYYFAATALSPDGTHLVMGMASFPRIYIFRLDKGTATAIAYGDKTEQAIASSLEQRNVEMPACCTFATIHGEQIYALVLGQNGSPDESNSLELHIYNMEGKHLSNWKMDEFLVNIAVLGDGYTLVGITMDGELYRYELKA
ncbi:MAG: hypothetical protein IJ652_02200 [Bacteroidales bacterium]|nr:hypothetical protein [Bacteroidales bacterium]